MGKAETWLHEEIDKVNFGNHFLKNFWLKLSYFDFSIHPKLVTCKSEGR